MSDPVTRALRAAVGPDPGSTADAELVRRFADRRDADAFELLVHRHAGMVRAVARAVLRDDHLAEDAAQAAFLLLAKKATTVRGNPAGWLYRTARHLALRMRRSSVGRAVPDTRRRTVGHGPTYEADDLAILHEELAALPDRYRLPVLLCHLEGLSHADAAARLGWPVGTVAGRLSRAKAKLRGRLARRGLAPAVALTAVGGHAGFAAATARLAVTYAAGDVAGVPPTVLALASGAYPPMSASKLLILSTLAAATVGGGAYLSGVGPPRPDARRPPADRTLALPDKPFAYAAVDLPPHFLTPQARRFDNTPADNPVTDAGATLGRVLFYDTRLSANRTVSCGSCHKQDHAFSDPERFSTGLNGGRTDRHAMSLVNLRYVRQGRFFWDERAGNLERMVLLPIQSKLEMGHDLTPLVATLKAEAPYPALFAAAFGDGGVTADRVGRALAQFVRTLVSHQSKYDAGMAAAKSVRDDFPTFTAAENRGKRLFVRNCAICHLPEGQAAHFSMVAAANTGLDANPRTGDGGVGDITLDPRQLGRFKPPSLRNVEVTAPYMHDGRFATLEQVVGHYSTGLKPHPNLDPRLEPRNYTPDETADLVAFLKTLTDPTFLTDPKFADPFR